ncbi:MAG: ATP-binding protein [Paludibacteraceae bacterium]
MISKYVGNIKIIVLIGYLLLFSLAVFGLIRIYKELVNFSDYNNPSEERKELNIVSNALVAMYEAESIKKVFLADYLYAPSSKSTYDKIDQKVRFYVDSLYLISKEEKLHLRIDTVNSLLDEKKLNFLNMISLMDSIKNLPYSNVLNTKLLNHKAVVDLDKIARNRMIQTEDTSFYVKKKKSLLERVRSVFSDKSDSTRVVNSQFTMQRDSLELMPSDILTDTLVYYINTINDKSDKRKVQYITKLTARHSAMLYYDEMLTDQINSILSQIETDEKRMVEKITNERATVLQRSSRIVSIIALASLFVLLLFLTLTILLINRNQRFRNELEKSNRLTQQLLKSREQLLLMISHDIKSPLSSIIGHIELMADDELPEEDKEHLNSMRISSEHILDLSNKLMDYHRLEQGKSEINLVSFYPYRLMDDIFKSFLPMATNKNLFLKSGIDIDSELVYRSDPFVIRQIINNLISNGLKFTNSGGITVQSTIDVQRMNMHVSVRDTGIGIKPDDAEKLFDEFKRFGTQEDKHNIDGFGLGLPITKRLVELLNGKIELNSEVGSGTEFNVTIPLQKATENNFVQDTDLSEKPDNSFQNLKLLWIDDDIAFVNVYSKLLERKGVMITKCVDSLEVEKLLGNHEFDIIFTDIQMPKMNGFELVKKIRNSGGIYAEIPIVALSGRSDVSERNFKSAGFSAFLSKPISTEQLLAVINKSLNNNAIFTPEDTHSHLIENSGFEKLIEYVKEDRESSLDLLNTFLEDNIRKLNELKDAAKISDWEAVKNIAHKMLPLITLIGESESVKILALLESGEQNREEVDRLIPMIENINLSAEKFIENFKNS